MRHNETKTDKPYRKDGFASIRGSSNKPRYIRTVPTYFLTKQSDIANLSESRQSMRVLSIISLIFITCPQIRGFVISSAVRLTTTPIRQHSTPLYSTEDDGKNSDLKAVHVENVISDMHESGYPFRIVVVGNGAILETTSTLGPTMKSSISKKTGGKLVTLASEDQSFEFHVKVNEVDKVVFVESVRPMEGGKEKVMRICRFINGEGGSICSLILGESGEDAIDWFSAMKNRYGDN